MARVTVPEDGVWAAFPLAGERVRLDLTGEGWGTLTRLADGAVAGHFSLEAVADSLVVRELVVDEAYRGYGLGTDAGRLLREFAETGHWKTFRAWAHPDLGLSVYFWVRMGLHPCFGDGPNDGTWFERSANWRHH